MPELPIEIGDTEKIVRATKTPSHYDTKKNRLKPAAFRPKIGETLISVMRELKGADFCKDKAVEICGGHYIGLSVIRAEAIRIAGSTVTDARDEFHGHAHVDHGFPAPDPSEPSLAAENERMVTRCRALASASTFHRDPTSAVAGWAGNAL